MPDGDVRARLAALETRVHTLAAQEAARAGEHAAMVDRLDRLYKRISARMVRENNGATPAPEESPLALRQRLRGL
jgi:hypothetical protein